jgi:hypothetical protein
MGKVKMRAPMRSAIEVEWQRQATAAAVESARKLIGVDGKLKPGTPIGKLSDYELGWIICTGICAWIVITHLYPLSNAAIGLDT